MQTRLQWLGLAALAAGCASVGAPAPTIPAKLQPAGEQVVARAWEAGDGSRIVGTVKERADAPSSGDIPWLLLATRAEGPAGTWSRVTSIQRINTRGGVAPATGCGKEQAGTRRHVAYKADYILFAAR